MSISSHRVPAVPVAILDDHHAIIVGVSSILERTGRYQITVQATSGAVFIQTMTAASSTGLALVDLSLPDMTGFDVIAWMKEHRPDVHVLAFSYSDDTDWVRRALGAGASGFLLKDADTAELVQAADGMMNSGSYLSERIVNNLKASPVVHDPFGNDRSQVMNKLRPNEIEFIRLLSDPKELTFRQIADLMGNKSEHTIDGYARDLRRFNCHTRASLALLGAYYGITPSFPSEGRGWPWAWRDRPIAHGEGLTLRSNAARA